MPEPPVPFPPQPHSKSLPLRQNTFRVICRIGGERYAIDVTAAISEFPAGPGEVQSGPDIETMERNGRIYWCRRVNPARKEEWDEC